MEAWRENKAQESRARKGNRVLYEYEVQGIARYERYIQRGEGLQLYRQDMPVTQLLGSYSNKL